MSKKHTIHLSTILTKNDTEECSYCGNSRCCKEPEDIIKILSEEKIQFILTERQLRTELVEVRKELKFMKDEYRRWLK